MKMVSPEIKEQLEENIEQRALILKSLIEQMINNLREISDIARGIYELLDKQKEEIYPKIVLQSELYFELKDKANILVNKTEVVEALNNDIINHRDFFEQIKAIIEDIKTEEQEFDENQDDQEDNDLSELETGDVEDLDEIDKSMREELPPIERNGKKPAEGMKFCPNCKKEIPKYWTKHYECGWGV